MQSFLQKIFFLLILLAGYATKAQVKFSASISPAEIGKDEYTQLKLMVENAAEVQQIIPPNLKNFIIVSGPNQESGMTMINGSVKKYIALNFVLKPKAVGNFIIRGALAKADGVDFKSNSVSLKVTAKSPGNNQGSNNLNSPFAGMDPYAEPAPRSSYKDYILRKDENPMEKIKKNMFVRAEIDKTSCYVGEPVVASFKLYTRLKSESNMIKNLSFNGFSVIDLQQPNDMSYHIEKFQGREYNVYTIRKAQLYPLLPGNLELGIAEIENNVHFIKSDYVDEQNNLMNDLFRDFANTTIPAEGMENHKVTLQNKPLSVLVKPLPDANKPANFKGAVGNFDMEARVEKNNFSTDDDGKLAIIISGSGNLQMINAPEIAWPRGIEAFDSKATDDLYKGTVPVSGRKIFEFPFTVSKPGSYIIPAITFSFFNNKEAKYKTITTNELSITIAKGSGKPRLSKEVNKVSSKDNYLARFFSNRLRVVSVVAVFIIIGLIVWLKRDTKKEKQIAEAIVLPKEAAVDESPVDEIIEGQQNPLALAEEYMYKGDGKLFYITLNEGLKKYLSKKLVIAPEELNKKNISRQLDKKGINNETVLQLHTLMDEIEFQLYTPFTENEKMKEIYERAYDVIQLLNTYHS
jgi:hypothetical protein